MTDPKNTIKNNTPLNTEFFFRRNLVNPNNLPNVPEKPLNFAEKTGFYYPEYIAKSDNTLLCVGAFEKGPEKPFYPPTAGLPDTAPARESVRILPIPEYIPRCTSTFITGQCGTHRHLKAIVCGKEYCLYCGVNDSIAHKRRVSRWWNKAHSFDSLGYLVVTIPAELRDRFHDSETLDQETGEIVKHSGKKVLADFKRYVRRKLQRETMNGKKYFRLVRYMSKYTRVLKSGEKKTYTRIGTRKVFKGYDRGMIRYHYFGDCDLCRGEGCEMCSYTGTGKDYKPHLNVILPEGFVEPVFLEKFKQDVALWFKKRFSLSYIPGKNCHYKFYSLPAQKTHKIKYVTRSTFRIYSAPLAKMLYRFHTSSSWGKYNLKPLTFTEAAQKGCCKYCMDADGSLEKITWNVKLNREQATRIINTYKHIENGYYMGFLDIDQVMRN